MALVSIGIVGKDNEPLYLCDFVGGKNNNRNDKGNENEDCINNPASPEEDHDDDPFGFFHNNSNKSNVPLVSFHDCSLHFQFILHASLDRLEEMTAPGQRWRTPGATGSEAMWVGLLCPVENYRVYGYLTTTNIKILAIMEDYGVMMSDGLNYNNGVSGGGMDLGDNGINNNSSGDGSRDGDLKALFAKVHGMYVEYTLNPFTKIKAPIVSNRFDTGVHNVVSGFNNSS